MSSRRPPDVPALENWLWGSACVIRGPIDAPEFRGFILPLILLKQLSIDQRTHLVVDRSPQLQANAHLRDKI